MLNPIFSNKAILISNSGIWPLLLLTRFRTTYLLATTTLTKRKPPNFWSLLLANADTGWAKPATEPTQHLIMTGSSHMLLSSWRQPPNPGQVSWVNSLAKAVGGDFGSWLMVVPIQQRPNCGGWPGGGLTITDDCKFHPLQSGGGGLTNAQATDNHPVWPLVLQRLFKDDNTRALNREGASGHRFAHMTNSGFFFCSQFKVFLCEPPPLQFKPGHKKQANHWKSLELPAKFTILLFFIFLHLLLRSPSPAASPTGN